MLSKQSPVQGRGLLLAIRDLTVKERILLHLFDFNRHADEYEAPLEVTQSGIAKAVGIRVTHVTQYVKPLTLWELVEDDLRHIQRQARRRKAYFLTPAGRQRVASLRRTLLEQEAPFRRASGEVREESLSRIYQQERRGTRLLELLQELRSSGYISEAAEAPTPGVVDLSQEAPEVEQFYGRGEELERVLHSVGRTPLTVVTGIAGIGKSTLGSKVCEELRGQRALLWRRVRPWDTPLSLALRLADLLKQSGRPALYGYLRSSGIEELARAEEILRADLASTQSLLVFDDVHTASPEVESFLSLLFDVLRNAEASGVLMLSRTVPRFYSRRDVEVEEPVVEIPLGPLDAESGQALLAESGIPEDQVDRLLKLSGGNPLFLKILTRTITTPERIGSWDALESYIAEEIEPVLTEDERNSLQVAALYEVPVRPEGLLLEQGGGLGTIVGLRKKGLLDAAGDGRVVLHDALRDFFRRGLPLERRKALVGKVTPWLQQEAEAALSGEGPQDAISYLENAILIEVEPRRRIMSLELLGDARHAVADFLGAVESFRSALRDVGEDGTKARLHRKIATCLFLLRKLEETDVEIERGLQLLPSDRNLEYAWLLTIRANVAFVQADFREASRDLASVTSLMPELPEDLKLEYWVTRLEALVRSWYPTRREMREFRDEWTRLFELAKAISDSPSDLYFPLLWLALSNVEIGETDEGMEQLRRTVELGEAAGRVDLHPLALLCQGWCLLEFRGDYEAAEASLERSLALFRESPSAAWRIPWCYRHFTDLYWRQGRLEEARESLAHFLKITPLPTGGRIENLSLMARLFVEGGDVDTAKTYLQEATDLESRNPSPESTYFLEWAKAAVDAQQGEPEKAESHFERALSLEIPPSTGPGNIVERLACSRNPGELLLDFGRFLFAEGRLEKAAEVLTQARDDFRRLNRKPREFETQELLEGIRSTVRPREPAP